MSKDQRLKPIFFWSDLHIFHANVLEFDKRPFRNLDHMHEVLINNYNSTVPENGICYFLGDIGLCKSETLGEFMSKLNGSTKILIAGNHDKGTDAMYKLGFDVVLYGATLKIAGEKVTMTHCPLLGVFREDCTDMKGSTPQENWHGESREKHKIFTTEDHGQFHLHGHCHTGPHNNKPKFTHNQFDVGVAANLYRPVSISVIESWIAKSKQGQNLGSI